MKRVRDAERTKSKILKSAEKVFADRGFSGTSIAMISEKSGISDGLILYHFKSKENLYMQVIEKVSANYLDTIITPLETNTLLPEAMVETLNAVFDFWNNDETCQRLSLWAFLEGKEDPSKNETKLTIQLVEYLESLKKKGYFPDNLNSVVFLTMIIGSIQFWVRYKTRFIKIINTNIKIKDFDKMFMEQFSKILKNILFLEK